jgi:transposase InsO family protein
MGPSARREYVRDVQLKYRKAEGRREKGRIISEVCENLGGCHRKHAIRLLNGAPATLERPFRHRDLVYPERLIRILEAIWEASQHLWSERLKSALPLWLPWIKKRWKLDAKEDRQLLRMSPRTMDRRLASYKRRISRRIYGKTKPGRLLRRRIPIQTESWDIREPGWMEADTVSHSGPSAQGVFAYTVNETDLFSGWVESWAVLGKKALMVRNALHEMRLAMPFEQKGIDSDNGDEFVHWELDSYCRETGLRRFRSRPYKKNDQAHIEQKNWTNVRQFIGWDRYDVQAAVDAMNDLYRNELRLLCNLFLPSVKLTHKIRVGSKLKRVHDDAKTPLDRLLESGMGDRQKLDEYRRLRKGLDPFELSRIIDKKLERIWSLASKTPVLPAPQPSAGKRAWWGPRLVNGDAPDAIIAPCQDRDIQKFRCQLYRDQYFGSR